MAIIPENESKLKTTLTANWLHILGGSMVIGSITVLAILGFKTNSVKQEIMRVEAVLEDIHASPEINTIREYEKLERTTGRLKNLTRRNISAPKILDLIQEFTLAGTVWTRLSVDGPLLRVSLHGTTAAGPSAITHIGAQTESFENKIDAIASVILTREPIRANATQSGFGLELILQENYFLTTL